MVHNKDLENIMDRKEIKPIGVVMANITRSLINTIRERHMKFIGHVYRKRGVEHLSMTVIGKIEERRSRRQRSTYVDSHNTLATSKRLSDNHFMGLDGERRVEVYDRQCLL